MFGIEEMPTKDMIFGFIIVVAAIVAVITWLDKGTDAFSSLKKKVVDRRFDRLLEASNKADEALRSELLNFLEESRKEHEQFKRMFDNDKRALDRHDKAIEELQKKQQHVEKALDTRLEETTLLMKSVRALMAVQVFGDDASIVKKAMDDMDEFLIEGRKEQEHEQRPGD